MDQTLRPSTPTFGKSKTDFLCKEEFKTEAVAQQTVPSSDEPWTIVRDRYKLSVIIGRGASGHVVKAIDRFTRQRVAIKHIQLDGESHYAYKKVIREIQILRHLS